ncbi:MAG: glycine/betaine ABC transporter substrate-binding protein [Ktedonobacteraceae bacterium]|nr:glycine/betaine ABC transporter substrate-binding protein [Ktedonobacteraceae bacterium]
MFSFASSVRVKTLLLLVFVSLLTLSACSAAGNGSSSGSKGTITVATKLDTEGQLLGEMYTLLLQKAGYTVNFKPALGQSPTLLAALQSGAIDMYPEFTATGLNALHIPSTYNPQKDYQNVKDGFEKNYHITWLDVSPLDDGYALCTSKSEAQTLNVTTISQLAPLVSKLTLATQSDGVPFFDNLQHTYGFSTRSFQSVKTLDYSIAFAAVKANQAQVTECYGTDSTVPQQGFLFLKDDKNGFPAFNPAPIVRDAVLSQYPDIATVLNKLAPKLTTDVSISLQLKVAADKKNGMSSAQAITKEARGFLQSQGLL